LSRPEKAQGYLDDAAASLALNIQDGAMVALMCAAMEFETCAEVLKDGLSDRWRGLAAQTWRRLAELAGRKADVAAGFQAPKLRLILSP
jgi:hypothetical protein